MNSFTDQAQAIYEKIRSAKQVLVLVHPHTDGDNIGAALAMFEWCRTLPLKTALFCEGEIPKMYQLLSHVDEIKFDRSILREAWDLVLVFDSGDIDYAGLTSILPEFPTRPGIINIDHHQSNTLFGDLNLVERGASSTVEVLHRFFTINNIAVSKTMATGMFLGLVFDTGCFRNAATTPSSLDTAARLLLTGVRPSAIEPLEHNKTVGALKLWGLALSRLQSMPSGCVVSYLTLKDFTDCGATDEDTENLTNFFQTLKDVPAMVLLKEKVGGFISGSCRTTRDDVDVAALSKQFGGGGHKKAAGFLVGGSIIRNVIPSQAEESPAHAGTSPEILRYAQDDRVLNFNINATDEHGQKLAAWLEQGAPLQEKL